jgi:hypothetical protein
MIYDTAVRDKDTAGQRVWNLGRGLSRQSAYIVIVVSVMIVSCMIGLRRDSLFSCQASGYGRDRYLAYCQATHYGDYDHGALWFGLEPGARGAAANADVIFLGNSRMQFAFSTEAVSDWFSALSIPYYLMGFSHNGNYKFEWPLLQAISPQAKAYVVNLDLFFEQTESPPAKSVMQDAAAKGRYEQKRRWQALHRLLCTHLPALCGDEIAFFRSRATGAWVVTGGGLKGGPVAYEPVIDPTILSSYSDSGNTFLSHLSVDRGCVILTMVPTAKTGIRTAQAIATALGTTLIAPELDDLHTFDGSHLDRKSAQRWSAAFIEAAGPRIQQCLDSHDSRLQSWNSR